MDTPKTETSRKQKPWSAWNICKKDGLRKPMWNRIGVAFANQDGSFSIILDSLPMDGKVHIREEREKPVGALQAAAEASAEAE